MEVGVQRGISLGDHPLPAAKRSDNLSVDHALSPRAGTKAVLEPWCFAAVFST